MPAKYKKPRKTAPPKVEPQQVIAEVSPLSRGGRSLFDATRVTAQNVSQFHSEAAIMEEACRRLERLGIEVLLRGFITCTVKAPRDVFERVFGVKLRSETVDLFEGTEGIEARVTSFTTGSDAQPRFLAPPRELADVIEGVVLPVPHTYFQSPLPPPVDYFHLKVPSDVSLLLNADQAHQSCVTGRCVRIAMVDSGHFAHPFYAARGYRVEPVVLSPDSIGTDPQEDEVGHGSKESANIFATAPAATLIPVKTSLADAAAAVTVAIDQNPDIISCSWGRDLRTPPFNALPPEELPLAAAIAEAVRRGIIVCFSAGNGHIGWPAMHPDVIAVGGVFAGADASLQASDYASSFTTPLFPGRSVPDLCGLVGQLPRGIYIMLPGQPGSLIDNSLAGGAFPNGDETLADDGWACISGTSASCPQIAGICALLLEACSDLNPSQVRQILRTSARDVVGGSTNPSANQPPGPHTAVPGPDLATGAGLADANAAVQLALRRSKKPAGRDCGCKKQPEPAPEIFEYAVKFICGTSKHDVVAHGEYFTAINIRNPTNKRVRFSKSFSIALPGETAGPVSKTFPAELGPREAMEIDCADIYRHTRTTPCCFLKGFAVLRSRVELDVVAVYTAAKKNRRVETLDIERIDPRRLAAEEPPDDYIPPPEKPKLPDLIPVKPFPPGPPFFPSNFCKSPQELAVIVRNQGAGPAAATTTRVHFVNLGMTSDHPTLPLGPGDEVELSIPIPSGCYVGSGDVPGPRLDEECKFRITVNAVEADGVAETTKANNSASGSCVVLM